MTRIAVLGAGMMATALATPLTDNGHEVHVVGPHLDRDEIQSMRAKGVHPRLAVRVPPSVRAYQLEEVAEAFEGASVVMVGVNSFGPVWAGQQLATLLTPGQDVCTVAKGMVAEADGTLRILPDVMAEQVPAELRQAVTWSAVVGPSIAGEVAARRHTAVVFAGRGPEELLRPLGRAGPRPAGGGGRGRRRRPQPQLRGRPDRPGLRRDLPLPGRARRPPRDTLRAAQRGGHVRDQRGRPQRAGRPAAGRG